MKLDLIFCLAFMTKIEETTWFSFLSLPSSGQVWVKAGSQRPDMSMYSIIGPVVKLEEKAQKTQYSLHLDKSHRSIYQKQILLCQVKILHTIQPLGSRECGRV